MVLDSPASPSETPSSDRSHSRTAELVNAQYCRSPPSLSTRTSPSRFRSVTVASSQRSLVSLVDSSVTPTRRGLGRGCFRYVHSTVRLSCKLPRSRTFFSHITLFRSSMVRWSTRTPAEAITLLVGSRSFPEIEYTGASTTIPGRRSTTSRSTESLHSAARYSRCASGRALHTDDK